MSFLVHPFRTLDIELARLTNIAKFTGYQYGGRPLGITFVKYATAGAGGDPMEASFEPPAGITQDQIM